METIELPQPSLPGLTLRDVECFEDVRPRLFGIARRMLGNAGATRTSRAGRVAALGPHRSPRRARPGRVPRHDDRAAGAHLGQSARARHEIAAGELPDEAALAGHEPWLDAEQRDALERALLRLLERLTPAERAAYILREAFDYPHRSIAEVLGLSEQNARQIFIRARRRLAGERRRRAPAGELRRLRDAFLAATQRGDLAALEQVLLTDDGGQAIVGPSGIGRNVKDGCGGT